MRVLVACEESQVITIEMRKRGHEAFSCDVQPCSGGHPEWHIQDDVVKYLDASWDLIIAHPPCTYLSNAGANRLRVNGNINLDRMEKARQARDFFMQFFYVHCPRVAIENPVPGRIHELPPYNQIIQPYMFGDPWLKTTCLWLRGLPALFATELCIPEGKWVEASPHGRSALPGEWDMKGKRNPKLRSKTFLGVARAMATQWG